MSLPRALIQTVESLTGFLSVDQIGDDDLEVLGDALRATHQAVVTELLERAAARGGRLPVSYPWPDEAGGAA